MFVQIFDGDKTVDTVMVRNPEITNGTEIGVRGVTWKVITIMHVTNSRIVVWAKEVTE